MKSDNYPHANLANLAEGASLRPRLSALPSVCSRTAHTSDSVCDLRDSRDSREIQSFVREDSGASALENALLRSFMTKDRVNKRAAYARHSESRIRIASFFGSTNNPNFLSDEYGNLRYMPFLIDHIDSPYDNPIDYDRFYGQLYHEYKSGFKYVLTKEEEEMLRVHNEDFEAISIEEENIQIYFRVPSEGEAGEFFQVADVINHIRRSNPNLNLNITRVRNILRKKYGYKKNGNRNSGYQGLFGAYLVPYTAEERKANRKGDTAEPVDNRPMDASECINLELPF